MRRNILSVGGAAVLASGLLLAGAPGVLAQMRPGGAAGQSGSMNQQQQQPQPGMQPNNMQTNGPMSQQNRAQANFLATMRRNSKVETDLSKMALKNSTNDQVKQLATQVISENRKNEMELTNASSSNAQPDSLSFAAPVPKQTRQAEKKMKKLTGTPFDEMYLSQMDGYIKNDQQTVSQASSTLTSSDMASLTMRLRNTADQRAGQIAQVAQSENFKVQ